MAAGRQKTPRKNAKRKPRKQSQSKPRKRTVQPRKPGRPRKLLDYAEACRLASFGIPQSAVAETLGVSTSTLARAKAESPEFSDAYDKAIRKGTGDWITDVAAAMRKAIRAGHTGPILAAWETIQRIYGGEGPGENPLILEIPLAGGSTLLVPEGLDPIEAVKFRDNVQEIPRKEP